MYQYGTKWIGTDISENQIEQAKLLSKDMDIEYFVCSAENLDFPDKITSWEKEHLTLLDNIAPDEFDILHYAAIAELKKKNGA